MLISVVIPTYNRAHLLASAIDSILNQTYRNLEIVIVDDGSTDNTRELVRDLTDPRIRYIYQDNRGVAAALNTGWRAARAELIGRLDSDDLWLPTLLAKLVPFLEADASVGVVYARAQGMDEHGRPLAQLVGAPEKYPGRTLVSLLYGDFVSPMAVLYRRSAIERIGGYDESLMANEDWDVWIRMAEQYKFVYVPQILARYRFHSHNLTRSDSLRVQRLMQDRVRVLGKFFARSNVPPEARDVEPLAFANLHADLAIRHLTGRRWRAAIHEYALALGASRQPILFLPRIVGVTLFNLYLSKWRWSVRFVDWIVQQRRQWTRVQ